MNSRKNTGFSTMNKKTRVTKFESLRKKAEEKINNPVDISGHSISETVLTLKDLVHELQVHQIEIQMQNDELLKAQEKLYESEKKYMDLYHSAPAGYVSMNNKGEILDTNLTAAKLLHSDIKSITGKTLYNFVEINNRDTLYLHLLNVLKTKERQTCELLISFDKETISQHGNKSFKPISFYALLESVAGIDNKGNPCSKTTITDITRSKQKKEQLLKSEANLARSQKIAHLGNWEWDIKNDQINWSEEIYHIFGVDVTFDISHKTIQAHVHPDDFQKKKSFLNNLTQITKPRQVEYRILRPDGAIRHIYQTAEINPGTNGKQLTVFGIMQDITERKIAEEKIKAVSAQWQTTFNSVSDAIALLDENQKIIRTNKSMEKMFPTFAGQMTGKYSWHVLHGTNKPVKNCPVARMQKTLSREIEEFEFKDFIVEQIADPVLDEENRLIGSVYIIRDITERKNAEKELQFKSLIISEVTDAIIATKNDKDYTISYWNKGAEKVYGWKAKKVIGTSATILNTTFSEKNKDEALKSITENGRFSGEVTQQKKDGTQFPVDSRLTSVVNEQGKITHWVAINRDITQRKNAENEIMKAKEKAELYLDMAGSIIVSLSAKGEILLLNHKGQEVLQYSEKELLGKNWFDTCIPGPQNIEVKEMFKNVINGTTDVVERFENDIITKSGEIRTVVWHNSFLRDNTGKINSVLGSGIDITEQNRAALEIKQSHERFDMAMDATRDGLFDWDLINNKIYYSPGWKNMLGYEFEELAKNLSTFENLLDSEGLEKTRQMHQELLHNKRDRFELEFKMKHKDGHWVNILSRANVYFDENGKAIRIVGTHVDLTRRKKAEQELIDSRKELRALANHLETIREEERAVIAREIHDEFGQVLTALKLNINFIEKRIAENKNQTYATIDQEFVAMNKLIDKTIVRVRNLISLLRPDELDNLGITATIANLLCEFTKNSDITCKSSIKFKDEIINNEKALILYRILQETLSNAIKHSDANLLTVKARTLKGSHQLAIIDNGRGFDISKVDKTKSFGLLGIQERLRRHNGKFFLNSDNKGTQIKVSLPID